MKKIFFVFLWVFFFMFTHQMNAQVTASNDATNVISGISYPIPVLNNDVYSCTSPTVTITSFPTHGTATISGDSIVYTSNNGYTGTDLIGYQIDCNGTTSTATVSLFVAEKPKNVINSSCHATPPANAFDLQAKYEVNGNGSYPVHTMATPLIGDVDGDGETEIVAPRVQASNNPWYSNGFIIFNGKTGAVEKQIITIEYSTDGQAVALADVDGDGKAELFVMHRTNFNIYCYDLSTGSLKSGFTTISTTKPTFKEILQLVDINNDGNVELVAGPYIYNAKTGAHLLTVSWPDIKAGFGAPHNQGQTTGYPYNLFAMVDVNGDGDLEQAAGPYVFDIDLSTNTSTLLTTANTTALNMTAASICGQTIAIDFDNDGEVEIVVAGQTKSTSNSNVTGVIEAYAYKPLTGEVISRYHWSGTIGLSIPYAGDLDGNGTPEFIFTDGNSGTYGMTALTYDETSNGTDYKNMAIMHRSTLFRETAGFTVFDFNQDGKVEIVYRGAGAGFYIVDGQTLSNLSTPITNVYSGTVAEYPLVADVDGDGHADIITVSSDKKWSTGDLRGKLRVYESVTTGAWAPAKSVWNSWGYTPYSINEDLSVPKIQVNPATKMGPDGNNPFNLFLAQTTTVDQNGELLFQTPNVMPDNPTYTYNVTTKELVVSVEVCNTGEADLIAPFYVSFYKDSVSGPSLLGTTTSITSLSPAACQTITFTKTLTASDLPINGILVRVNDDGTTYPIQTECHTDDNVSDTIISRYTITYDWGIGTGTNPADYNEFELTLALKNATAPIGYSFTGWTGSNGTTSQTSYVIPDGTSGNLTYTANYKINNYTIKYVLPTGAIHPQTPNGYVFTDAVTVTNPTLPGYVFLGWTITNDSTSSPVITPTIDVSFGPNTVYGNLTFTAETPPSGGGDNPNWHQLTYNITYDLDGGTHGTNHPDTYVVTDNVTVDIPTKLGYTFTGWTITSDSTSASIPSSGNPTTFGPGDKVYGNLTFIATWTINKYTVTYDLNGGVVTAPTDTMHNWNTSVTVLDTLPDTYMTEAVFLGWSFKQIATPNPITAASDTVGKLFKPAGSTFIINQDTTLYAVWAEDKNGPNGIPDSIPDYLQIKLIYNENQRTGSQSISGTLPPTTMHTKNTSATVSGNTGNLQRNPADSLILIGWSKTVQDNKDVKIAADKPADLILCGITIPVAETDINLYAVWAYDGNGNSIPDCDEPNTTITPEHEWPETEPGTPTWNYQYDRDNSNSWYSGCEMTLTTTISPDPNNERIININYLGALKKGFVVDEGGEILEYSYTLAKGDSVFTLHFSIVEDSITSANEGQSGAIETAIVGGGRDTSAWFNLYAHPSYDIVLVKPLIRSDKTVDFGITGGTSNLMRSINGGVWHNAYSALTSAEQLSVTDGASIWLREPNGCWEAEFMFMTYTDPTVLRYVDLPSTEGVTTNPGVGKHYVEGHQDFTFTASYAGSSPLKVMAKGYYTGTYEELIGQNMDDGTYKYTIIQVTEPWNVTFGPDLASGTVDNELTANVNVWSFNNMLYIHSDVNAAAYIYNISGTLYKRLTVNEGYTHEEMMRGIYVVIIGDSRYKVIIK